MTEPKYEGAPVVIDLMDALLASLRPANPSSLVDDSPGIVLRAQQETPA